MTIHRRYVDPTVKVRKWDPPRLTHVGSVGALMRTNMTGSKRDSAQGCGQTRRRTSPTGTPC